MLCIVVDRKGRKSIFYVSCASAGPKMKLISVKGKAKGKKEQTKEALLRQETETIKSSSLDTCQKK